MYFLAWLTQSEKLQWTSLWMLLLGALGAAAALISGFYAAPGLMISESVRNQLLTHHKHLMVATSLLTAALTLWALASRPMPTRFRPVFLLALLALVLLLTIGADLGGEMVYAYNAAGTACPQPIDYKK